ncbi:MAG: hypothetical protein K5945_11770 [Bacteroidaceae bacterium]|nr:hypothetical protein [Bacteroidaceae bacterium]
MAAYFFFIFCLQNAKCKMQNRCPRCPYFPIINSYLCRRRDNTNIAKRCYRFLRLRSKTEYNAPADHVDEEDKGTLPIRESAYETRAIVINESGLYSLILSSKLEQTRAFKH